MNSWKTKINIEFRRYRYPENLYGFENYQVFIKLVKK